MQSDIFTTSKNRIFHGATSGCGVGGQPVSRCENHILEELLQDIRAASATVLAVSRLRRPDPELRRPECLCHSSGSPRSSNEPARDVCIPGKYQLLRFPLTADARASLCHLPPWYRSRSVFPGFCSNLHNYSFFMK